MAKYALLIALENYMFLRPVPFAENDLNGIHGALLTLDFLSPNCITLVNSTATKTTIETNIKSLLRRLQADDELWFFYAGHGTNINGTNFITCYDSVASALEDSCISLQAVFQQIRSSNSRKIILFLDSCHSGIPIDDNMRSLVSELDEQAFLDFCNQGESYIAFASCASEEGSYSASLLSHGIWTHHLIEALSGNAPNALERERYLTAMSLQNFLSKSIPTTLLKTHTGVATQTPRFFGNLSREVIIADLQPILEQRKQARIPILSELKRLSFWGQFTGSIKSLSGFKSGHRVPRDINSTTKNFVESIGTVDLGEHVGNIAQKLRESFRYKRSELIAGNETIKTPQFTVNASLHQNEECPDEYILATEITDIKDSSIILTPKFSRIFSGIVDSIVFESKLRNNIDEIIDLLESNYEVDFINYDAQAPEWVELEIPETNIVLRFEYGAIRLTLQDNSRLPALIEACKEIPKALSTTPNVAKLLLTSE